ncbi:sensor histidine kinase [Comamonas testosteroni]|uniref:sensor histidine kinase n=1 Tax=Comamonas testosteroni TaxID=285 RepID=UPI00391DC09B
MAAVAWLLPRAYRSVLWRRRKSVRPSIEVQQERRRIAEALHDDVGSQLVQLISLTDLGTDPAIRRNAEQCLLDLRLIVDSMDSRNEPLGILLARFRHRLQPVVDHRGMNLHWDVWDPQMSGDIGSLPCGPMAEEIMAVVKEAVSNVLQHTDALELWITLAADEQWKSASNVSDASFVHARLSIEDAGPVRPTDGRQIPDVASAGMGWVNMRRRALVMGAKLSISARPGGGTSVTLNW